MDEGNCENAKKKERDSIRLCISLWLDLPLTEKRNNRFTLKIRINLYNAINNIYFPFLDNYKISFW